MPGVSWKSEAYWRYSYRSVESSTPRITGAGFFTSEGVPAGCRDGCFQVEGPIRAP